MFQLAKARAREVEPRKIHKSDRSGFYAGYSLTQPELMALFYSEGFTRDSTIRKYQDIWAKCGWITRAINGAVFFALDPNEDSLMIQNVEALKKTLSENGESDITYIGLKEASA